MKYVIRNCPCNVTAVNLCSWEMGDETYCQDCTGCLLKKIVELCKNAKKDWEEIKDNYNYTDEYKNFKSGREDLGRQIIDFLLDIQEVEE